MHALILALVLAAGPSDAELEALEAGCNRDFDVCAKYEQAKAAHHAELEAQWQIAERQREAERAALLAQQHDEVAAMDAAEEAEVTKTQKKCGKNYGRVHVGMSWKIVRECAGDFELKYEDERAQVYEAEGGLVRVEHGKITRVWRAN